MRCKFRFCVLLLMASSGALLAQPPLEKREGLLVDDKGMVLYTFDKDGPGISSCYSQCAALWPPLHAVADAAAHGEYTLVRRKDGHLQWAHKGRPLYYWLADTKPGQASGEAVEGWHLVR